MSFLNRLILNKQGRLPLVKPRIPGRFEMMPAETVPGTLPDSARPFSKPIVKDFHATDVPPPPADATNSHRQNPSYSTRDQGTFSRSQKTTESVNTGSVEQDEGILQNIPEAGSRQVVSKSESDEAEGILIERYYLTGDTHQEGYHGDTGTPVTENTPVLNQKIQRFQQGGSPDPSVTIHIGTVEVRAIVEEKEKPRKKSTSRKPEMSLQEYLDKKNKKL